MKKYRYLLSAQLPYHIAAMLREQQLGHTHKGPNFENYFSFRKHNWTDLHEFMRDWLEHV